MGLLFGDHELECRRLLGGCDFLSTFMSCRFLGLLLGWLPWCFRGATFIVLCGDHLRCRCSSNSSLCTNYYKGTCWCSAYQCRTVFRIGSLTSSTNRAFRDFSSYTDPPLSALVNSTWAYSDGSSMLVWGCTLPRPALLYFHLWHSPSAVPGRWGNRTSLRPRNKNWWNSLLTLKLSLLPLPGLLGSVWTAPFLRVYGPCMQGMLTLFLRKRKLLTSGLCPKRCDLPSVPLSCSPSCVARLRHRPHSEKISWGSDNFDNRMRRRKSHWRAGIS